MYDWNYQVCMTNCTRERLGTGILRVSKQVSDETLPVLYGKNLFSVEQPRRCKFVEPLPVHGPALAANAWRVRWLCISNHNKGATGSMRADIFDSAVFCQLL